MTNGDMRKVNRATYSHGGKIDKEKKIPFQNFQENFFSVVVVKGNSTRFLAVHIVTYLFMLNREKERKINMCIFIHVIMHIYR